MKAAEKNNLLGSADIERLSTWARYHAGLCDTCRATCCTMPVEVKIDDLIRMEILSEFDRQEPLKKLAKQLKKQGIIDHFNFKNGVFTLSRMANDDCLYLDRTSRRCTIYSQRPDTCRNHPHVGPRPGYCPFQPR
ncbi:YkgJ family cysteine cluster protein [uncultured Desulfuromonas sp.]|uniref:YkgJ family cysteine cluster protein n=1 Tax=uncultured Desulfuromonas sp. TaxID=181013 RepID=UPI002AAABA90|nr:YkgJ family cysteine cluster protein [uncultured Desulfuromonas sp.]